MRGEDSPMHFYHCEDSRRLGVRIGRKLRLGFSSFQSFKNRFQKRLFPVIFKVFFVTNQRYHEQYNLPVHC